MSYGTLKIDTITFTDNGIDKSVSVSGLVQNPSFSGNITATGTISGNIVQGQTISGVTVTGTTAAFTTGTFISLTGTTTEGTTATYTTGSFTSLTGTTTTGTTATFASGVFTTQISGATITGNAAAFTTVTGGVATITSGVFASGTAAAPSVSVGTTDNGIYSPGTDQVAISTNGVQRINIEADGDISIDSGGVFYDATNNRLAVGTTTPQAPLSISNSGANGIEIYSDYAGIGQSGIVSYNRSTLQRTDLYISTDETIFATGGSERARIDSSGRLLVGTASARTDLIAGTRGGQVQIEAAGSDQATVLDKSSLCLTAGNGNATSAGPYLFFTRSYSNTLGGVTQVVNNTILGGLYFQGTDGTDAVPAALIKAEVDGIPGANDMPGRLMFSVTADGSASPTEAMRINNAGELLVGYTSDNGAYKLQVNSQIFATSATIATSDGRYKENVATLDGCVDLVKALRPVSFDWKHQEPITRIDEEGETVVVREAHNFPDGTQVGFIAQEVETVLADKPWLGSVIKQNIRPAVTDNDGNELAPEEEFLGIAEGNLVAVLTSALKDAIGEIESLKARVAALEAS